MALDYTLQINNDQISANLFSVFSYVNAFEI